MTTLFSSRWHRVASLRPRLSAQVRVRRHLVRGERWMVLSRPSSGRSVRLDSTAYAWAGRLDGSWTMQQLWDWQLAHAGDAASQDDVIDMLAQLCDADLLQLDSHAEFELVLHNRERRVAATSGRSVLAWRVPLIDPSRVLHRMQRLASLLFSRAGLVVWLLAIALLLAMLIEHAPALWAHGVRWLATPRFVLLAALMYVPVKLIHELAHALAVRRWGGEVHEAGVTLMLGMPVPYVDASSASAFVRRRHRAMVGAAGVMAELVLAALALALWSWLGDGLARDIAFVTLVIAGVSTLLFNLNPLQRLDGYYIATDLLELPNLAARSSAWWRDLLLRRLLRAPDVEAMAIAPGERPWLAGYAPLSWSYGIVIAGLAVFWLGHLSFALGLAAAALLAWQLLLRPAVQEIARLRRAALGRQTTARRWRRVALCASVASLLGLLLPLPRHVLVAGVVWPTDQAQLRAEEDGFVDRVAVVDGEHVAAGAVVLQLSNPRLLASLERQRARVDALEIELFNALPAEPAAAGNTRAELVAAQLALDRLMERTAGLQVRAQAAGRIVLPRAADLPGQYVRRGQLLGQVLGSDAGMVRMALLESDAEGIDWTRRSVSVRMASAPDAARRGTLIGDGGGAARLLPSAAFSARHGGDIQTDPGDDLKPLQPVVLLDVRIDGRADEGSERLGERAWVRHDAGMVPVIVQAAQAMHRAVQRQFNPQF